MRQILLIAIFVSVLLSCSNNKDKTGQTSDSASEFQQKNGANSKEIPQPKSETISASENLKLFKLTETISADFNGDGQTDEAKFTTRNGKNGIIILDGKSKTESLIGCGNALDEMGDDLGWADSWGLFTAESTFNVRMTESGDLEEEKVFLDNPGIVVTKDEAGGGMITFKNGKYIWLQQSC